MKNKLSFLLYLSSCFLLLTTVIGVVSCIVMPPRLNGTEIATECISSVKDCSVVESTYRLSYVDRFAANIKGDIITAQVVSDAFFGEMCPYYISDDQESYARKYGEQDGEITANFINGYTDKCIKLGKVYDVQGIVDVLRNDKIIFSLLDSIDSERMECSYALGEFVAQRLDCLVSDKHLSTKVLLYMIKYTQGYVDVENVDLGISLLRNGEISVDDIKEMVKNVEAQDIVASAYDDGYSLSLPTKAMAVSSTYFAFFVIFFSAVALTIICFVIFTGKKESANVTSFYF